MADETQDTAVIEGTPMVRFLRNPANPMIYSPLIDIRTSQHGLHPNQWYRTSERRLMLTILTYDDLQTHFAAVARHVRPGGLYIIDKDISKHGYATEYSRWGEKTIPIRGGEVEIWHESFPGDWINGHDHMKYHSVIHLNGEVYETVDEWRIRYDTPSHLRILMDAIHGWELDGFYRRHDLGTGIADESHYFMVVSRT